MHQIISDNPNVCLETMECVCPPSNMLHLFTAVPHHGLQASLDSRVCANSMALTALKDVRISLLRIIETFQIFERFLEQDNSWAEETSSSYRYSEQITEQEDIDHL